MPYPTVIVHSRLNPDECCQLEALLTERTTQDGPAGVYLCGDALRRLKNDNRELFEALSASVRSGAITLLGGLYAEPLGTIVTEERIRWHCNRTVEFFTENSLPIPREIFVPEGCWHPSLPEISASYGMVEIIRENNRHTLATIGASQNRYDVRNFVRRVAELTPEVASAREAARSGIIPEWSRYADEAEEFLARAEHGALEFAFVSGPCAPFPLRREAYAAVLEAQVAADSARYPNVDPFVGWLHHSLPRTVPHDLPSFVIDSQLARITVDIARDGEFSRFDYKPRKINLANFAEPITLPPIRVIARHASLARTSPPTDCAPPPTCHTVCRLLRSAPDLLLYRLSSPVEGTPAAIERIFSFKAGFGAHLNHATTGYSMQFWLEDVTCSLHGSSILLSVPLVFPSGEGLQAFVHPLLCVGGISRERLSLSEAHMISGATLSGGLYGLRLVDPEENFTVDFRFAKAISCVQTLPIADGPESRQIIGATLVFQVEAEQIWGDEPKNTLFFSIL